VDVRAGAVYALAGRRGGVNFDYLEAYSTTRKRWGRLPPVPDPRGGTGAAAVAGGIVSVGGEEPAGTIAPVFVYDVRRRRWTRLPDMRTPRHGLAVVAYGRRVYAIAGGPQPGLHVSSANEYLQLR
jgi:non-specific serine/threonine protein kinase